MNLIARKENVEFNLALIVLFGKLSKGHIFSFFFLLFYPIHLVVYKIMKSVYYCIVIVVVFYILFIITFMFFVI